MRKYRILLLLCCLVCPVFLKAQVSFNFLPEVHGRTLEGLFLVKVGNMENTSRLVTMAITVTEARTGKLTEIRTKPFQLRPGMNQLPAGVAGGAALSFANNKQATVLKQSNFFPEGDYDYCFEIKDVEKNGLVIGDQCFNYALQPFSPLLLMEPFDGDNICERRPTLFWQPLMPAVPGVQYRLILAEVKQGQGKVEALNYNLPLLNQTGISTPMLFYPPTARQLEEGKRYTWQVMAYRNELLLASSEIWEFVVKCTDSLPALPDEGFRNINDLTKGNFYIANGRVMFAMHNMYDKTSLEYSVQCLTKPEMKIGKLPKVKLDRGSNQITIDLSDHKSFVDGYFYIMQVKIPGGQTKQLRFIYKNASE
ncbi:DUF928 domain-containing protein [Chitinophaga horti]|uniref:DUF928 domain-containing protein n=1 Tax=Chitinophaga horti TaxID=2920382 RepID=A0ABY6J7C8_9BACT|nr:DUF928 domain-containing protein [Chitinophaga horti]UYQ95598.1 DUF928 domain-containing protein [Chitinophaga horti]